MKTAIVNLANEPFFKSQYQLNKSAKKHGIDLVFAWSHKALKRTLFYKHNSEILSQQRGIGYWLWKPFIILEAMKELDEGDILFYSDAGIEIISDIQPLISLTKRNNVLVFNNCNYTNNLWVKRDCFVLMDCDSEKYWNGQHIEAAFQCYRVTKDSIDFVKEWFNFARNKYILTDLPNTTGKDNLNGFIEHRWDQSVLSLLVIKYNLEIFRNPTQFGNHYKHPICRVNGEFKNINHFERADFYSNLPYANSAYPTILNHHRTKTRVNSFEGLFYNTYINVRKFKNKKKER